MPLDNLGRLTGADARAAADRHLKATFNNRTRTNQELIDFIEKSLDGAMKTPVSSDRQLNEVFQGFVEDLASAWPEIKVALEQASK